MKADRNLKINERIKSRVQTLRFTLNSIEPVQKYARLDLYSQLDHWV